HQSNGWCRSFVSRAASFSCAWSARRSWSATCLFNSASASRSPFMIRSLIAILASPSATPASLVLVSSKRQALALDDLAPRSAHAGWRSELSRGTTPTYAAMPARHLVGGIYQLIDIDSFSARVGSAESLLDQIEHLAPAHMGDKLAFVTIAEIT